MKFRKTSIINNQLIAPGVYLLYFNRWFDFIPGQVVSIRINSEMAGRLYSICSSNKSKVVQILYKVREEGLLTPLLSNLKKGDVVEVSEPFGNFIHQNNQSVFIATGTGIAPFMSMILSGHKLPEMVIYGTSYNKYLHFNKTIVDVIGNSNFIKCVTKELVNGTFNGRVTDYINSINNLKNIKYYLCGNPNMVVDTRDLLIKKGVSFNNIMSEIYF
ncbi:MAG: hypothetical protein JXA53_00260 [Bacteroidales bacterium]|nr:hypothetical protein [Bacteroidales bacterium]